MAESFDTFIALVNSIKKYSKEQQNKNTSAKLDEPLRKQIYRKHFRGLTTTKGFTKQGNLWKLKANGTKKQGKESNVPKWLTDAEVNILYDKYLH